MAAPDPEQIIIRVSKEKNVPVTAMLAALFEQFGTFQRGKGMRTDDKWNVFDEVNVCVQTAQAEGEPAAIPVTVLELLEQTLAAKHAIISHNEQYDKDARDPSSRAFAESQARMAMVIVLREVINAYENHGLAASVQLGEPLAPARAVELSKQVHGEHIEDLEALIAELKHHLVGFIKVTDLDVLGYTPEDITAMIRKLQDAGITVVVLGAGDHEP